MQKKVIAHCLRVQFFFANPVFPHTQIRKKIKIKSLRALLVLERHRRAVSFSKPLTVSKSIKQATYFERQNLQE